MVLVVAAALWLRTHDLAARPMHFDEANQAVKFGQLLEHGNYAFDPRDHHGPTLYYLTLPVAWARGQRTLPALDETTVRLLPALAGTLSVVLMWLLARPLGTGTAFAAALLLAVAPAAVYYNRYYVQESLLVLFTLGAFICGHRWWLGRGRGWALATGVCAGLMLATKTSALLFGFVAVAALATVARGSRRFLTHPLTAVAAAAAVAVLFYSSFLTHPVGLRDAFASLGSMADRAAGGTGHDKPWWYYASLLVFRRDGGYLWDQSLFLAMAVAGLVVAWRGPRRMPRLFALYAVVVAIALSLTPYKTPWIVVNLVPVLAVLAALAWSALAGLRVWGGVAAVGLGLAVIGELAWQTRQAVFRLPADPRNPYAYVHSSPDVLKVRALAEAALARDSSGSIKIISEEYWPLPWYLRGYPHVGYWNVAPADCDGALVISSASLAGAVRARLHGAYRESYLGLRPNFLLVVFEPAPAGAEH